jgi:hypothetical protein
MQDVQHISAERLRQPVDHDGFTTRNRPRS